MGTEVEMKPVEEKIKNSMRTYTDSQKGTVVLAHITQCIAKNRCLLSKDIKDLLSKGDRSQSHNYYVNKKLRYKEKEGKGVP